MNLLPKLGGHCLIVVVQGIQWGFQFLKHPYLRKEALQSRLHGLSQSLAEVCHCALGFRVQGFGAKVLVFKVQGLGLYKEPNTP